MSILWPTYAFSILQLTYTFSILRLTYTCKNVCKLQNTLKKYPLGLFYWFLTKFGTIFLPCILSARGKQHIESPTNEYQIYVWLFCDLHSYLVFCDLYTHFLFFYLHTLLENGKTGVSVQDLWIISLYTIDPVRDKHYTKRFFFFNFIKIIVK